MTEKKVEELKVDTLKVGGLKVEGLKVDELHVGSMKVESAGAGADAGAGEASTLKTVVTIVTRTNGDILVYLVPALMGGESGFRLSFQSVQEEKTRSNRDAALAGLKSNALLNESDLEYIYDTEDKISAPPGQAVRLLVAGVKEAIGDEPTSKRVPEDSADRIDQAFGYMWMTPTEIALMITGPAEKSCFTKVDTMCFNHYTARFLDEKYHSRTRKLEAVLRFRG